MPAATQGDERKFSDAFRSSSETLLDDLASDLRYGDPPSTCLALEGVG